MAPSSIPVSSNSTKYLTKISAMEWSEIARKHPSRSSPGQIDAAKLERIYRKMDAALQGYYKEPSRIGSESLDALSMHALFNFGRAVHFTSKNGAVAENISLLLRKWGALSLSHADSEGRKGIVIGGKWLSQDSGLRAVPYSASARHVIHVGDIVVVGYPSDKDKRYGRVREVNHGYFTINIGEQIPIQQSRDKLHVLDRQPQVIERSHPEMHAFLITEPTFNEFLHPDFGQGEGLRSICMRNFMEGFKRNFHRGPLHEAQLKVDEVIYTPATGGLLSLSQKPVVSCGSSSGREVIVLNPKNSPLLNAHYNHIVAYLKSQAGHPSEKEILTYVKDYIRNYMLFRSTESDLVGLT
ncbi:MAG: hypothetical protein JSR93_05300 [Verrucomicrobia bacterium]|nr:hypothetical protein [Verrucomicrobiota bacterium]